MISIKGARKIGLSHRREGSNSQDAFSIRETDKWLVGAVCDGCGSGERSETGALRSADYLAIRTINALEHTGRHRDIGAVRNNVWWGYIRSLEMQLEAAFHGILSTYGYLSQKDWVERHLLHTAMVIIASKTDDYAWMLTKGDGYVLWDNQVVELKNDLDSDGGVVYPAMALNTHKSQRAGIPFNIVQIHSGWRSLAIATDGLRDVPKDRINELLFSEDDDEFFLQNSFQFAAEDGWLKNEDDLCVVTIERSED